MTVFSFITKFSNYSKLASVSLAFLLSSEVIKMIYKISFKDGVSVTIENDTVVVESLSKTDVDFNIVANKAMMGEETSQFRLMNLINNRLGVEAL